MVAAGRAALNALSRVSEQRAAFFLDDLHTFRIFERSITVASVRVVSDLLRISLVGCATVAEDPNYAAAQAVLGAVNRSFTRLIFPLRRRAPDTQPGLERSSQLPRHAGRERISHEDRVGPLLPSTGSR
jgi:hypothetical protein